MPGSGKLQHAEDVCPRIQDGHVQPDGNVQGQIKEIEENWTAQGYGIAVMVVSHQTVGIVPPSMT